jgi:hypothetical protein
MRIFIVVYCNLYPTKVKRNEGQGKRIKDERREIGIADGAR